MEHGKLATYNHRGCRCDPCTAARRDYDASWRARNSGGASERGEENARKLVRVNKDWLRLIKAMCGCAACGEGRIFELDFHHKDPSSKSFDLGAADSKDARIVQAEVRKCEVLCKKCHIERHREMRSVA